MHKDRRLPKFVNMYESEESYIVLTDLYGNEKEEQYWTAKEKSFSLVGGFPRWEIDESEHFTLKNYIQ